MSSQITTPFQGIPRTAHITPQWKVEISDRLPSLQLMAAHGWPLPRASVMGPEARPLLQQPPSSPSSPPFPPSPAWH